MGPKETQSNISSNSSPITQSFSEKGAFGDSFGSVNSLFTGLAFAGIVFTILLQQREISLQRKDFNLQIDEMKGSKAEMAKQNMLIKNQIAVSLLEIEAKGKEFAAKAVQVKGASADKVVESFDKVSSFIATRVKELRLELEDSGDQDSEGNCNKEPKGA